MRADAPMQLRRFVAQLRHAREHRDAARSAARAKSVEGRDRSAHIGVVRVVDEPNRPASTDRTVLGRKLEGGKRRHRRKVDAELSSRGNCRGKIGPIVHAR